MPNAFEMAYVVLLVVFVPALALRSKRRLDGAPGVNVPYSALLSSILVSHGVLAAITLYLRSGIPNVPTLVSRFDRTTVFACVAFLAISAAISVTRWRATGEDRRRRLRIYLPRTRAEHCLAILLHAFVACVEELVYRAVLFAIVDRLCVHVGLPAWWPAAILSSAAFGLGHIVQGWYSALAVGLLGIGFHAIVRVSDGLAAAIVTHFIFDTVAIAVYARLLREPDE